MNYIYTAGYANRTPEQFRKLLAAVDIVIVVDVRREGSRARISAYIPGKPMERTLKSIYNDPGGIRVYRTAYELGNYESDLSDYSLDGKDRPLEFITEWASAVNVCIICCERDAYKNGEVNCHRVYVADAVVAKLREMTGEEWEVIHL